MSRETEGFAVGIEFKSILEAISKQIYETPLAFLRENAQNAVDALRMQAALNGVSSSIPELFVKITVDPDNCEIVDNGIGMTKSDLKNLFWTIGASGKRTPEARKAGFSILFNMNYRDYYSDSILNVFTGSSPYRMALRMGPIHLP